MFIKRKRKRCGHLDKCLTRFWFESLLFWPFKADEPFTVLRFEAWAASASLCESANASWSSSSNSSSVLTLGFLVASFWASLNNGLFTYSMGKSSSSFNLLALPDVDNAPTRPLGLFNLFCGKKGIKNVENKKNGFKKRTLFCRSKHHKLALPSQCQTWEWVTFSTSKHCKIFDHKRDNLNTNRS